MLIFVTGANGFIGQSICNAIENNGFNLRRSSRYNNPEKNLNSYKFENVITGEIGSNTNWIEHLSGVDCIIHCAAKAHLIDNTLNDSVENYREVNVNATKNLAEQAAKVGVKRLIFLSSIGVNGIYTDKNQRFTYKDVPAPTEAYALSKLEAERKLINISSKTGLEIVIIRLPLVYGPQVKGNFLRLMDLISTGIPLPFGKINNSRSFVNIDNLIDLILLCISHPLAAGQKFLISDGEDISTNELIIRLAQNLNRSQINFYLPKNILRLVGILSGKSSEISRLITSLQIDITHTRKVLGWSPPFRVNKGLAKMTDWYLKR
tara:strand:- start:184 stop:1143 length:960 start_codon:yes stop_codon:yes gene_type:complete